MVFALANPTPEIMPEDARAGGAAVVGTGRSDYPNQINNSLAFPGIFRGALDNRVARPVVVIGNITVGGTGKTPFTIWLADQLQAFVDEHPDFEVPIERLATWLARGGTDDVD